MSSIVADRLAQEAQTILEKRIADNSLNLPPPPTVVMKVMGTETVNPVAPKPVVVPEPVVPTPVPEEPVVPSVEAPSASAVRRKRGWVMTIGSVRRGIRDAYASRGRRSHDG